MNRHADSGGQVVSRWICMRAQSESAALAFDFANERKRARRIVTRDVIANFLKVERRSRGNRELHGSLLLLALNRVLGFKSRKHPLRIDRRAAFDAFAKQAAKFAKFHRFQLALLFP